jgi:hypothetical protein
VSIRALAVLSFFLAACAGTFHVKKLGPRGRPTQESGVRFFRPKPYLLVSSGDRGCEVRIIYLPDQNEQYEITPGPLGDVTVTLKDGWNLVSITGKGAPGASSEVEGDETPPLIAEGVAFEGGAPLRVGLYELDLKATQPSIRRPVWDAGVDCGAIE